MAKLAILRRWYQVMGGVLPVYHAVRLWKTGRQGGEGRLESARPLRAAGNPLTLWARPGTDDTVVFLELFDQGEYRSAESRIALPVRSVLDLGVNVGFSIALFAELYPEARFIGVEPDANNFAMATRTLQPLIEAGRVKLHNGFIGARERKAVIERGGSGGSNEFHLGEDVVDHAAPSVQVFTVPSILDSDGVGVIDLLKCDIEGGEKELFDDCNDWIGRVRNLVVELHAPLDSEWLKSCLTKNGWPIASMHVEAKHAGASLVWASKT